MRKVISTIGTISMLTIWAYHYDFCKLSEAYLSLSQPISAYISLSQPISAHLSLYSFNYILFEPILVLFET